MCAHRSEQGLRRKPGNAAAKREYGEWTVIGSNLLYLNYKEREEGDTV